MRLLFVLLGALIAAGPVESALPFSQPVVETSFHWRAGDRGQFLSVVISKSNDTNAELRVPGFLNWWIRYDPDSTSVARLASEKSARAAHHDSLRAALGADAKFSYRDGPSYPRYMSTKVSQVEWLSGEDLPEIVMPAFSAVRDTIDFGLRREDYRGWPGAVIVEIYYHSLVKEESGYRFPRTLCEDLSLRVAVP